MSKAFPPVEVATTHSQEKPANTGWFSRARRFVSEAGPLLTALIAVLTPTISGAVTDMATKQPAWGLAVAAAMFVLLIAAKVMPPQSQSQPVVNSAPENGVVTGTFYHAVGPLPRDMRELPGWFLSTVRPSPYRESPAGNTETDPVNLLKERRELEGALKAARSKVILVHGPPGAGKTTLVSSVLRETGSEAQAQMHDLASKDQLDAKALLDDIVPDARSGAGLGIGEDLLDRLEAEMAASDGAPVTIVVDGAQSLFGADNHMEHDLARALEVIASSQPRRVKVILIVQDHPIPGAGSAWHGTADRIFVGGLRREGFKDFLERLNPAFEFALPDRTTTEFGRLYDVLQGNPRLAELFCAALGLPESELTADGLVWQLAQVPAKERERLLASEVLHSLSVDQRRVVRALAAYGMPVTTEQVNDLLAREASESEPFTGQVDVLIPELVNWRVIGRVHCKALDQYYVSASGIEDALLQSKELSWQLLWRAASQLPAYQREEEEIQPPKDLRQQPKDLRQHFAELDILIRVAQLHPSIESWGALYGQINQVDTILRRWNAAGLLLKYRETIKGKLGKPFREMVNSNALGCIYMSRGRFDDAREAFNDALQQAKELQQADARRGSDGRRKILINLAALDWNSGNTKRAEDGYREALDEYNRLEPAKRRERDAVLDLMAAEEGLADCRWRRGHFDDAIGHGKKARFAAARGRDSSSSAGIAVKLARWHSELGRRPEAKRLMKKAKQLMKKADDTADHNAALRMQYLTGEADLLLDDDRFRFFRFFRFLEARRVARKALNEAPQTPGAPAVLQARTALATSHLMLGDIQAARSEIDLASQGRRAGWFLDVLALRALIAFRSDPDGDEARKSFEDLKREAVQRQEHDDQDFAACDFEGLAICGLQVPGTSSLDEAAKAFKKSEGARENARKMGSASGVAPRLEQWLDILRAKATPDQWRPVSDVLDGTTAGSGRS